MDREGVKANAICFMSSRVKFEGAKDPAPFPTAVVVFGIEITPERLAGLESLGRTVRWRS
jgi:hypothetical protein